MIYIFGYGTRKEFCNIEVQRLLVKYNFIDWLICSIDTIITDKEVINGILTSNLFEDTKYQPIKCKIHSIDRTDKDMVGKDFYWIILNITDNATNEKKQIRYLCCRGEKDDYIKEMRQCINKDIIIIALKNKNGLPPYSRQFKLDLCCILDTKDNNSNNRQST